MKREEKSEQEFSSLLAACDDSLALGRSPPIPEGVNLDSRLRARLDRGIECMRLLRRCLASPDGGTPFLG